MEIIVVSRYCRTTLRVTTKLQDVKNVKTWRK